MDEPEYRARDGLRYPIIEPSETGCAECRAGRHANCTEPEGDCAHKDARPACDGCQAIPATVLLAEGGSIPERQLCADCAIAVVITWPDLALDISRIPKEA